MSPAYLKKRILEVQPEMVEVYERNVPFADFHVSIPVLALKKGDDYNTILDDFFGQYQGQFTALIRQKRGDQRKNGERIVLINTPVTGDATLQPMPINGLHPAPVKSEDEIRKEILSEVRRELELERLRDEVREMQRQTLVQNGLEARLLNVAERLFGQSKLAELTKPIQGTQVNNTTPTTMAQGMHDINNLSEAQTEELENAIAEIFQHLGYDTLLKVRDALRRDPALATKLQLFI